MVTLMASCPGAPVAVTGGFTRNLKDRVVRSGLVAEESHTMFPGAAAALSAGARALPTNTTGARSTRNGMVERLGLIFSLPFAGTVWGVEIRGSNL